MPNSEEEPTVFIKRADKLSFQSPKEIYLTHYQPISSASPSPSPPINTIKKASNSLLLPKSLPPSLKTASITDEQRKQRSAYLAATNFSKGAVSSLLSTLFMLYMTGNSLQIFPLIMLCVSAFTPIKAIFYINKSFASYEKHVISLFFPKFIYFTLNSLALIACLWKANQMNLIPLEWLHYDPFAVSWNTSFITLQSIARCIPAPQSTNSLSTVSSNLIDQCHQIHHSPLPQSLFQQFFLKFFSLS